MVCKTGSSRAWHAINSKQLQSCDNAQPCWKLDVLQAPESGYQRTRASGVVFLRPLKRLQSEPARVLSEAIVLLLAQPDQVVMARVEALMVSLRLPTHVRLVKGHTHSRAPAYEHRVCRPPCDVPGKQLGG